MKVRHYTQYMITYKTVSEYLQSVPKKHVVQVKQMRALIKKLVPKGEETIRYGMPTIQIAGKNFVHYAAMKGHLGFYPTPSGVSAYKADLAKLGLKYSKGCIQLPYTKPLPVTLIKRIVTFRLKEERSKK